MTDWVATRVSLQDALRRLGRGESLTHIASVYGVPASDVRRAFLAQSVVRN